MDRETIARRIKALLAKTVEHGASEAEAITAAEKARELMAKYVVEADDLDDDRIETSDLEKSWRGPLSVADQLYGCVARYCDCQPWHIGKANKFTGRISDTLFATWLLDALDGFVNRKTAEFALTVPIDGGHAGQTGPNGWTLFDMGPPRTKKQAEFDRRLKMASFKQGLIDGINRRLMDVVNARPQAPREQHFRAIAVVLAKNGIVLKKGRSRSSSFNGDINSYRAGRDASSGAGFNRPINGGGKPVLALK